MLHRLILLSTFIYWAFFFTDYANGQTTKKWTLQECIEYANQNNIQIKQKELSSQLDKYNLTQSYASLLPDLNAGATHVYNYGQTIDRYTNQFATQEVRSNNFYVQSSVVLFQGFQKVNTLQQNRLNFLAGKYDVDKLRNDISLSIALAYLQILFAREMVEAAKAQLEITKLQLERTQKLYQAKAITEGSLLDIQAQYSSEELQLVSAENQYNLAKLNLAQMLDLPPDNFEIDVPIIVMPENQYLPRPDDAYNAAVSVLPQIKSAELRVQSADKMLNAARGLQSPVISLQGSFGTGYSGASKIVDGVRMSGFDTLGFTTSGESVLYPKVDYTYKTKSFADQIDDNFNKSFGFYLQLPLFNGLQTRTNIQKAKINRLNAEYTLQLTKNQLRKDIEQAYADALAASKKYNAVSKATAALEESFRYMQQKFDVGAINSTDYNIAKNKLTKARSDLLQAKYDYIFKVKVLEFYQGKPINLN